MISRDHANVSIHPKNGGQKGRLISILSPIFLSILISFPILQPRETELHTYSNALYCPSLVCLVCLTLWTKQGNLEGNFGLEDLGEGDVDKESGLDGEKKIMKRQI